VVFLLASFPDLVLDQPRAYFTAPATRSGLVERLVDYYLEVSHGRLLIEPTVARTVVTVAHPRARYVQRPSMMVRDAFRAFQSVRGDEATREVLESADALVVFFAGAGKESDLHGVATDPWSNFTDLSPALETPGGHRIDRACVIAATQREGLSTFGVLCHEFGHLLGLPELYAPGGASHEGIGVWGLMGQGTWLGRGDRPPHPSAWSKVAMGWADVELVERSGRVTLPAVDTSGRVAKIWLHDAERPWAYFLIENRQRRGTDGRLPGAGLLIWRIDERIRGMRTSQSDPERMRVTLIQADGRDDLKVGHRAGGNRGDAGDAWRGMGWGGRILLNAAAVLGVVLVAAALGCAWRKRCRPWVAALAIGVGTAVCGGALGVPRSPVFAPDSSASAPGRHGAEDGVPFTISDISAPGDSMTFTVTFADRRVP
jgi:M6 family metalloprotease-like protein